MSITNEVLAYAFAAAMWFALGVGFCWAFMRGTRPNDHTAEDDAEQMAYLRNVNAEKERRKMRAYPITESKS